MDQLVTYLEVIHGVGVRVSIVNTLVTDNSYTDQGIFVNSVETAFTFANGVIVKQVVEFDDVPPSSQICPECWIRYEVIDASSHAIQPMTKTFISQCQQRFWVKMQRQGTL